MALFLCATMHQGDERFSLQTRGKQCAFMSLAAVITAQNNPLIDWSTTMFNNVLSQGDQMYFKALNKGLIVLEQDDEFLSMDNLPKVVSVSGCSRLFEHVFLRHKITMICPLRHKIMICPLWCSHLRKAI